MFFSQSENWSVVKPAIELVGIVIAGVAGALFIATVAQYGFNAAVSMCPLLWLALLIVGVVAAINLVVDAYNRWTGKSISAVGVICGGLNVVMQFFKNLLLTGANVSAGLTLASLALTYDVMAAFHNMFCCIKKWFYSLLSTATTVIAGICEALNQLPFISFDYSGITAAADDYAAKAAAAEDDKWEYKSISDAFNKGMGIYDTFQDGWASDAYKQGYEWGTGGAGGVEEDNYGNYTATYTPIPAADAGQTAANTGQTAANTGQTADNTAKIADSLDITNQELKYLRDVAERKAVNRYATTNIKIEMTNNNKVSSETDLDGFVSGLTAAMSDAMMKSVEGVHM